MNEDTSRAAVPCPACAPSTRVVHEILRPGGQATVRCRACGHVHKTRLEPEKRVTLPVIISQDGESRSATASVPRGEELAVGEEFVQETPEAIHLLRITSIELEDDHRVDRAPATAVATLWTRAVDNVSVNATIHPSDGHADRTRSRTLNVPGDYEFTVGDTLSLGEDRFRVTLIHVRDDATGYPTSPLAEAGDLVPAKDAKRVIGRDQDGDGWSPW